MLFFAYGESIPVKCFVDFWDYFGRLSMQISGVIYYLSILPLKLFTEIGS